VKHLVAAAGIHVRQRVDEIEHAADGDIESGRAKQAAEDEDVRDEL
jgi:hypothetical protein